APITPPVPAPVVPAVPGVPTVVPAAPGVPEPPAPVALVPAVPVMWLPPPAGPQAANSKNPGSKSAQVPEERPLTATSDMMTPDHFGFWGLRSASRSPDRKGPIGPLVPAIGSSHGHRTHMWHPVRLRCNSARTL